MALIPLKVPPGVVRNGTQYQIGGRWYDANLVRWNDGVMLPIGGWKRVSSSTGFTGVCRSMLPWRDYSANRVMAVGTNSNLYVWNESGQFYDITPSSFPAGRVDAAYGLGYGFGTFSTSTYGTPRINSTRVLTAATWSLDNWGQQLVACAPHDGKIYLWQNALATPAAVIGAAPTNCLGVTVTPERYLVALGASGNPRLVKWSTQEDLTVWTPTATNTAGDFELQTTGTIQVAKRVRGQTLILTDVDAHTMTYLGPPFIYGFERAGSFCGVASPNAAAVMDNLCVWMGSDNFFIYDGVVQTLPSDVRDYVFGDFNRVQASKVYAGANPKFNEVWWFYPSANSTENDRYVVWNYRERHWSIGQLSRTAWAGQGVFNYPMAAQIDGYLYEHENGWTNNGASLLEQRFAESGAVEIGNGDQIVVARQLIPDERTQGQSRVSFKTRYTPNGTQATLGPYTLTNYTPVRFSGRQVALRIEGASDADWRVGTLRVDAVPGGGR